LTILFLLVFVMAFTSHAHPTSKKVSVTVKKATTNTERKTIMGELMLNLATLSAKPLVDRPEQGWNLQRKDKNIKVIPMSIDEHRPDPQVLIWKASYPQVTWASAATAVSAKKASSISALIEEPDVKSIKVVEDDEDVGQLSARSADAYNWPISFHASDHPWVVEAGKNLGREDATHLNTSQLTTLN
jgi:hypothetical protein